MKCLIMAAAMVATLSGCVSTQSGVKQMDNIGVASCAITGNYPHSTIQDVQGYCRTELEQRVKAHTITADEIALGRDAAGVQMAANARASEQRDRDSNALLMAGAICAGSIRGC